MGVYWDKHPPPTATAGIPGTWPYLERGLFTEVIKVKSDGGPGRERPLI